MEFFLWNDDLRVGNTFIDNDHRHLIDLMNNLYGAMGEGHGPDVVEAVLDELIQYTQDHFKREENVMQAMRYADFATHKEAHDTLTREVLELQKKFVDGETKLTVELLIFLFDWLFNHILRVDKKLALAIREAASLAKSHA